MPNWNEAFGGVRNGQVTWQTFSNAELRLLNDYSLTVYPSDPIFTSGELNEVETKTTDALDKLKLGYHQEVLFRTGDIESLLHQRFVAKGLTTAAAVRAFWDQMPEPQLLQIDQGLRTELFTGESETLLAAELTRRSESAGGPAAMATVGRALTMTQLVQVIKAGYGATGDLPDATRVTAIIAPEMRRMLRRSDTSGTKAGLVRLHEALTAVPAPDLTLKLAVLGLSAFYAAAESSISTMIENLNQALNDPARQFSTEAQLMRWTVSSLVAATGLTADTHYLSNLACYLNAKASILEQPAAPLRPDDADALSLLFNKARRSAVTDSLVGIVRTAVAATDQATLDRILPVVYPVPSNMQAQVGERTSSTDYHTLITLQKEQAKARQDGVVKNTALNPEQSLAIDAAKKSYDESIKAKSLTTGVLDATVSFATGDGQPARAAADNAVQQLAVGATGFAASVGLGGFGRLISETAATEVMTWTGAATKNLETLSNKLPGELATSVLTGDFTGVADLFQSTVIRPASTAIDDLMARWFFQPKLPTKPRPYDNRPAGQGIGVFDPSVAEKPAPITFAKGVESKAVSDPTRKSLTLSSNFLEFLGLRRGQVTLDNQGVKRDPTTGAIDRSRRGIITIDDGWINAIEDNPYGALPKPVMKLIPADNPRRPFEFKLLPAVRSQLNVNRSGGDGMDVPFGPQGIKYHHSQNIASMEIAGGAPVFQSLGITGEVMEVCGAIISFGFRKPLKQFEQGNFPYGVWDESRGEGWNLEMNSTERTTHHALAAYREAEMELTQLARNGQVCEFTIAYPLARTQGKNDVSLISYKVLIRQVERIQVRRDKVFYKLIMSRVEFPTGLQVDDVRDIARLSLGLENTGIPKPNTPAATGFNPATGIPLAPAARTAIAGSATVAQGPVRASSTAVPALDHQTATPKPFISPKAPSGDGRTPTQTASGSTTAAVPASATPTPVARGTLPPTNASSRPVPAASSSAQPQSTTQRTTAASGASGPDPTLSRPGVPITKTAPATSTPTGAKTLVTINANAPSTADVVVFIARTFGVGSWETVSTTDGVVSGYFRGSVPALSGALQTPYPGAIVLD